MADVVVCAGLPFSPVVASSLFVDSTLQRVLDKAYLPVGRCNFLLIIGLHSYLTFLGV